MDRTLLANSPDWLKAAPMRENLLASWRQFGQKQDHCPSLLNHNAKYKRLLPPYCDFANGVRWFLIRQAADPTAALKRGGKPYACASRPQPRLHQEMHTAPAGLCSWWSTF